MTIREIILKHLHDNKNGQDIDLRGLLRPFDNDRVYIRETLRNLEIDKYIIAHTGYKLIDNRENGQRRPLTDCYLTARLTPMGEEYCNKLFPPKKSWWKRLVSFSDDSNKVLKFIKYLLGGLIFITSIGFFFLNSQTKESLTPQNQDSLIRQQQLQQLSNQDSALYKSQDSTKVIRQKTDSSQVKIK